MKNTIMVKKFVGDFAGDKEAARKIRVEEVLPRLERQEDVIFDFSDVGGATQSFVHALLSEPIRRYRQVAFDKFYFKNANPDIRKVIQIVYHYMQESLSDFPLTA